MVIFTDSPDEEIAEIEQASRWSRPGRRFYVFSKEAAKSVDYLRMALSQFTFVPLEETMSARFADMFSGNSPADFFVLKQPRLSNIMDRNIDMHQIVLKGRKLVIDDHPFLGKGEVFWSYFPYSFIDKSLMGYPHSYAFRDAKPAGGIDPFDTRMLARKVAGITKTYKKTVFPEPLEFVRTRLTTAEHAAYATLKEQLFETETGPKAIIRGLRKFTQSTGEMRAVKGEQLDLLKLNRVWGQYQAGIRRVVVSEAKVDAYLEKQITGYVESANAFFDELWKIKWTGKRSG